MDCKTARQLVPFARSGRQELERTDRAALESHLAECPDCRLEVEAEQQLDLLFVRAMRTVPIPAGLRERLLTKLAASRRRFYARWAVRGVAVAAGLLLAFLIAYRAFPDEIEEFVFNQGNVPLQFEPPLPSPTPERGPGPYRSKQEMLEQLREQGCSVVLPPDLDDNWDFRLLKYAAVENYEGKPTATLLFRTGTATAKVRLLPRGGYDRTAIDALRDGSDPRRRVIGHPVRDDFIALVELSEDARIEDFLHPKQTVA